MYQRSLDFSDLGKYIDHLRDEVSNWKSNQGKRVYGLSDKMYGVVLKTLEEETKKKQSEWISELKPKLSARLPKRYRGKRRLQMRKFPYKNSGDLVKSIKTGFNHKFDNGTLEIDAWGEILSDNALFTSFGYTSLGAMTSKGQWVGWLEGVLRNKEKYGSSRYGYVHSFDFLIKEVFRSKRFYNTIYRLKKKMAEDLTEKVR